MSDEDDPTLREFIEQKIAAERRVTTEWERAHAREHEYLAEAVREAKRVSAATVTIIAVLIALAALVLSSTPAQ